MKTLRFLLPIALLAASCRRDMQDQPRFRPFRPTTFFADGRSQRAQVPGTVARGRLEEDDLLYRGKIDGKPAEVFPFPITAEILARGRERHDIFCAPCHGRVGDGDGAVVERGMRRPLSYHDERLRKAPPGYLFDVITTGFGGMFDMSDRIGAEDRWAIVAYVHALQRSQTAGLGDVPDAELEKLRGNPMSTTIRADFDRIEKRALAVGAVASVAAVAGAFLDPLQFYRSYLVAWLLGLGLGLGSLAIVMLHRLTGGSWGFAIRRLLESGMRTLPLLALLFVPIALGMPRLYPWTDAAAVAADPLLLHKAPYLNTPFFLARAAGFFALWIGSAGLLLRLSGKTDRTGNPRHEKRARLVSGPLIGVYAVTMTLAAIDWAMSLEPHWFSTMYGMIFVVGQVLSTLAFAIIASSWLRRREPFARWLSVEHFHDLGNLMFAFVLLWAYTTFSQFLIIWSGNLSEETPWYLSRTRGGWQTVALALAVFHFLVPFFLLLWRRIKRDTSVLPYVALLLIVMRYVDLFWLVGPAFHPEGLAVHWLDFVLPFAIGGLWLAFFVHNLKGRPLLSLQDAHLEASLEETRARKGERAGSAAG